MKNIINQNTIFVNFEKTFRPLYVKAGNAQFEAFATGDEAKYAEAVETEIQIQELLSSRDKFEEAKEINGRTDLSTIQQREAYEIYRAYLSHQADPELMRKISELDSEINKDYSTFRVKREDKELTDNEIVDILENSNDSTELKDIWNESKKVGGFVAEKVIRITKLRNELARNLNFENYWEMSLVLQDFEPEKIIKLLDELDTLTRDGFVDIKSQIDDCLAKRLNIDISELAVWHYGRYFQDVPKIFELDLDHLYKDQELVGLTKKYYQSIGLEIEDILEKSDLCEKPGKNQHAFCFGIDAPRDVRVLCNVKPNAQWMDTMLHEFGHGVYDKYLDENLPWVLRSAAHIFTTEGIAIFFGALSSNPSWIKEIVDKELSEQEVVEARKMLQFNKLIFSRFVQVMFRFEKALYENPDQDLDDLWWSLVEKYQLLKRPEGKRSGDWASKIHIATAPVYYHNYLLGDLFASQLRSYIFNNVSKNASFANDEKIGEYLKERVFAPGESYIWEEFVRFATGDDLDPKYFAAEFCNR